MTSIAADVRVRMYRDGDDEQLVSLFEQSFSAWPPADIAVAPEDHLRWKFRHDAPGPRRHVVAESGGRLVGAYLAWPLPIETRGGRLLAVHGRDVCVLPEYQGQRVMTRITTFIRNAFHEWFDLQIAGFTRHEAIRRLHVSREHLPIANALRVFMLPEPGDRPARQEDDFEIVGVARFDERLDDFCRAAAEPFDFIVVRDSAYLNWRYCDPRSGGFQARIAQRDGAVLGYATTRVQPTRQRGHITDLLALPGRLDVAAALIDDAISALARAGVTRAECWLPGHHPYAQLLRDAGFRARRTRAMNYQPLAAPEEKLAFLRDPLCALHFTKGDSDAI